MKQEELENYIYTYGKDLYSFCCCMTHSRQKANDQYQDTFLKVFEMGEKLVIRSNPKSFLMSVALNLYRNYKRKLSVRHLYSYELEGGRAGSGGAPVDVLFPDCKQGMCREFDYSYSELGLASLMIEVYILNENGTITFVLYRPRQ